MKVFPKKLFIFLSLGIFVSLYLNVFSLSLAEETAVVWTDKSEYRPDETAYIFGYGFLPYSDVNVTVVRPDFNVSSVMVQTDQFGYFVCQYILDGVHGTFNVTATDGVHNAETSFDNCLWLKASWNSYCCTVQ